MYEKWLKEVNEGKLTLEEAKELFNREYEKLEEAHTLYEEQHKKEMKVKELKRHVVKDLFCALDEYYKLLERPNPFADVKVEDAIRILDTLTKVNAKSSSSFWDW